MDTTEEARRMAGLLQKGDGLWKVGTVGIIGRMRRIVKARRRQKQFNSPLCDVFHTPITYGWTGSNPGIYSQTNPEFSTASKISFVRKTRLRAYIRLSPANVRFTKFSTYRFATWINFSRSRNVSCISSTSGKAGRLILSIHDLLHSESA